MRIITQVKCPGCETMNKFRCVKPRFLEPTHVTITCDVCESRLAVIAKRRPGTDQKVDIGVRLFASPGLKAVWAEERASAEAAAE